MANNPRSDVIQHVRHLVLQRDTAALTDGQLLECFVSTGENAALDALIVRRSSMIWDVCRRVLPNYHDAEDAFQSTLFVLVRKAALIVPREMVANWLYGVAYQTALKLRATAAKRSRREKQVMDLPEPIGAGQELWSDLRPVLDQELSRLADKYRVVVLLCDLEGKTRKEAAAQLGWPEGTVASRLATARGMLAKRLRRHGLVMSGGILAVALAQNVASTEVPASLMVSTMKAARTLAAGTTDVISDEILNLIERVERNMLWSKLKIFAAALLAMGLLGGAVSLYTYRPPVQESSNIYALVFVEHRERRLLPEKNRSSSADLDDLAAYRRTQLIMLKSRRILEAALNPPRTANLTIVKQQTNALDWLEKKLSAGFLNDTGVLCLSDDVERVILTNAVANAYVNWAVYEQRELQMKQFEKLRQMKRNIDEKVARNRAIVKQLGVALSDRGSSPLSRQALLEELSQLRTELRQVHFAKLRAQARINNNRRKVALIAKRYAEKMYTGEMEEDVAIQTEQEELLKKEIASMTKQLASMEGEGFESVALREDTAALERLAREIADQLEVLEAQLDAAPRVRILQEAIVPERKKPANQNPKAATNSPDPEPKK